MVKNYDKIQVLRLMIMLSVSLSGLKKDEFDYLRRAYLICYGFQEMPLLMNLQDAQLLRPRDDKFNWAKVKKVREYSMIDVLDFQTY